MSIELYQVPAQANAIQATDELIVSDRSTVAGTGYRTFTAILRAVLNYVGALAPTDLVLVKTAGGQGWRSIADLVNSGPIAQQDAAATPLVTLGVTSDASFRVRLTSSGLLEWADGTGAADVNLYRSAAGALKTDGALEVTSILTARSRMDLNAAMSNCFWRLMPGGTTNGIVGVPGALRGNSDAGLMLFSETGMPVVIATGGSADAKVLVAADGVATFLNGATAPAANANETAVGGGRIRTYDSVISEAGYFIASTNYGLSVGGTLRFFGDNSYTYVNSPDGTKKLYLGNSDTYYDNGSHRFRNAAGTADGDVYLGNLYRFGSLQPQSQVTFFNNPASSYTTLIDLNTVNGSMWELTVGNATEGYMARAVFGKPSSSAGAVLLSEVHSHADLTITLVGNEIRINNGVSAIRTTFYTFTKLY